MQFLFPALTFGFFLVMAPVLIHLINMMRHRRVKWAAMDFLLASYKKSRKWVWLKQLLLLLLRMAAIAAVVAMLAQLTFRDQLKGLFTGNATHHYVLIDDSYSMSDRGGGGEAFDRAMQAVTRIVERAAGEETRQKITVIRYSQASRVQGQSTRGVADVNAAPIDGDFEDLLTEVRRNLRVTQLASGPAPALSAVRQILASAPEESALVYVVSDFRQKDWENSDEIRTLLDSIEKEDVAIHLVNCTRSQSQNLAIVSLEPAPGVPTAGVPMFAYVTVANYGDAAVKNVDVTLRAISYSEVTVDDPSLAQGVLQPLTTRQIEEILPGQKVTERIQIDFSTRGYHVVEAELPADSVEVDNRRSCVIDFSDGLPVLLVDGSNDGMNAYFLGRSLAPHLGEGEITGEGGRARGHTGILPEVQSLSFLRDASQTALSRYHVIYLLDVRRLDERTVSNLKQYVEGGGGLAFFMGEETDAESYRELYEEGEGLFPLPLDRREAVQQEAGEREPAFTVVNHPIMQVFTGERNSHLRRIQVHAYWKSLEGWEPPNKSSIRVLARMRGTRDPLVVEQHYGSGRVAVFLTSLSPDWNNWTDDGTFVVTMLTMQAYLSAGRQAVSERMVGTTLSVEFLDSEYGPEVVFFVPTDLAEQTRPIDVHAKSHDELEDKENAEPSDEAGIEALPPDLSEPRLLVASIGEETQDKDAPQDVGGPQDEGDPRDANAIRDTDYSGVYSAWLQRIDGDYDGRRYAYNVDALEGQMVWMNKAKLDEQYGTGELEIHDVDALDYELQNEAGNNWSQFILLALLGILIGEQALAYSAGYHPARGGAA